MDNLGFSQFFSASIYRIGKTLIIFFFSGTALLVKVPTRVLMETEIGIKLLCLYLVQQMLHQMAQQFYANFLNYVGLHL